MATGTPEEALLPIAAVARRLGVAPATLRTWDRRYGIGPALHQPGQHRRYSQDDLARLEALRDLLVRGVTVADAALEITRLPAPHAGPAPVGVRAEAGSTTGTGAVTARQVREAASRMDADRLVGLLRRAIDHRGVIATWDTVIRPALAWFGDRWEADDGCIAAEHVLSDCATTTLRLRAQTRATTRARPVLLACAPGEAHVLPLCALAAALAEHKVHSCLLGAAAPVAVTAEAIRRIKPSAVLVWSQTTHTADHQVLDAQPEIRSGHLVAAAGPGWDGRHLPRRVESPADITAAVALLSGASAPWPSRMASP